MPVVTCSHAPGAPLSEPCSTEEERVGGRCIRIPIGSEAKWSTPSKQGRELPPSRFRRDKLTIIATAISEIARN